MRALLFSTLFFCMPGVLVAQDDREAKHEQESITAPKSSGKNKKKGKKEAESEASDTTSPVPEPVRRTSRMNREKKSFAIGTELGPMFSATPGGGLEATANAGGTMQYGLDVSYGKEDLISQSDEADTSTATPSGTLQNDIVTSELSLTFTYVSAAAKFFLANSFYFSAGFGYRVIETNIGVSSASDKNLFIKTNT